MSTDIKNGENTNEIPLNATQYWRYLTKGYVEISDNTVLLKMGDKDVLCAVIDDNIKVRGRQDG